jgi:hypothetical protein
MQALRFMYGLATILGLTYHFHVGLRVEHHLQSGP